MGSRGLGPPAEEGSQGPGRPNSQQARSILTPDERLPRARRLAKTAQIRRLLDQGRRRRMGRIDVIWSDNTVGHPRIGLIVPKHRSTGVARNRLRRQVRELLRREIQPLLPAWDLLVRTRREAYSATREAIREDLLQWASTAGLGESS